jgi:hypothetical protein
MKLYCINKDSCGWSGEYDAELHGICPLCYGLLLEYNYKPQWEAIPITNDNNTNTTINSEE